MSSQGRRSPRPRLFRLRIPRIKRTRILPLPKLQRSRILPNLQRRQEYSQNSSDQEYSLNSCFLFSKYYNKWFVALENSFPWTSNQSAAKKASVNARVLVRLVKKQAGSDYTEVTLEAEGDWGPKQVFRVMNHRDIIGVDNQLVEV